MGSRISSFHGGSGGGGVWYPALLLLVSKHFTSFRNHLFLEVAHPFDYDTKAAFPVADLKSAILGKG